jgi:hypothetical protein
VVQVDPAADGGYLQDLREGCLEVMRQRSRTLRGPFNCQGGFGRTAEQPCSCAWAESRELSAESRGGCLAFEGNAFFLFAHGDVESAIDDDDEVAASEPTAPFWLPDNKTRTQKTRGRLTLVTITGRLAAVCRLQRGAGWMELWGARMG